MASEARRIRAARPSDTPVQDTTPADGHVAWLMVCEAYRRYDFGDDHPLTPRRLDVGLDFLRESGLLTVADEVCAPAATAGELRLVHSAAYVEALTRLSQWAPLLEAPLEAEARRYGLGSGDNPVFPGAHEAAAAIAGGSLHAARSLLEGAVSHVFHPMGGLHHAQADRASGFCLYNDAAIAIAATVAEREVRVLYVDFDVHHGDGVQAAFEDDPRVLTVSFHESGRHLFPGTGEVLELGRGAGRGFAVNVPCAPHTDDASWIAALDAILPPLVERFHPGLIVSQHGCDTHRLDPLADLLLTTAALEYQAQLVHRLAHDHCGGRWLALGGGGYDVFGVVPRSWALLWAEMTGRAVAEAVPLAWRARWAEESPSPLPMALRDTVPVAPGGPASNMAAMKAAVENARTVARVRRLVLPAPLRIVASDALPRSSTPLNRPTDAPGNLLPALRRDAPSDAVPGVVRLTGTMPETRTATLDTPRGTLLLRDWCPPSLVRRLHADAGLTAFTRDPARELDLLIRVAAHPDSCLALAHTPDGRIVSQVTICAPEGRWGAVDGVLELALETSRNWRRQGVAVGLLRFALEAPWVEQVILLAEGYSWHWDTEGTTLDAFGYRTLLVALLGDVGFVEEHTDEPDIASSPANVLLARIGRHVPASRIGAFRARLMNGSR